MLDLNPYLPAIMIAIMNFGPFRLRLPHEPSPSPYPRYFIVREQFLDPRRVLLGKERLKRARGCYITIIKLCPIWFDTTEIITQSHDDMAARI